MAVTAITDFSKPGRAKAPREVMLIEKKPNQVHGRSAERDNSRGGLLCVIEITVR
jgi:hypothetical protein